MGEPSAHWNGLLKQNGMLIDTVSAGMEIRFHRLGRGRQETMG